MRFEGINLNKLDSDSFQKFCDSFDYIFTDCGGVIWHPTPMKESGQFLNLMKKLGKKVHFVSNNSLRPIDQYKEKFRGAGIENGTDNLIVPSIAIAEYLKAQNFDKYVYCVCCPETEKVLKSYGFKCKSGPNIVSENYTEFVQYMEDDLDIGAVVFDSDFQMNMAKLYKSIAYLKRPDVLFLNGATDKYINIKPGILSVSPTFITDVAVEVTKREPVHLAKPGRIIGEMAMQKAGATDPSRVLFIGDMIEQDVRLGKNVGFKTLLVLTNLALQDMQAHEIKPDFYAKDLGSLVPKIMQIF